MQSKKEENETTVPIKICTFTQAHMKKDMQIHNHAQICVCVIYREKKKFEKNRFDV